MNSSGIVLWLALCGIALGAWVVTVLRQTSASGARVARVLAIMLSVQALLLSSAVIGWIAPDAVDELSANDRSEAERVIGASGSCGAIPFSRVIEIAKSADGSKLSFRCVTSHYGVLSRSGTAQCIGGWWSVAGFFEASGAGPCEVEAAEG